MGFFCSLGLEELVAIDTKRLQFVLGQALQQLELELSTQERRIVELEKKSPEELLIRLQQTEHGHAELAAGAEVAEHGRVELSRRLGEHADRIEAVDRLQHDARIDMQAIETRVKHAEAKASECHSETKATREVADSQLVALGRFQQKLEDVNTVAKQALEKDVDQLKQRQEQLAEQLADKLEGQRRALQETFCSRTVAEAMRQDLEEQSRALQSTVDDLRRQLMEQSDHTALQSPPFNGSLVRGQQVPMTWEAVTADMHDPGQQDFRDQSPGGGKTENGAAMRRSAQNRHATEEADGDSQCLLCTKPRMVSPAPAMKGIDGQVYLFPPANMARPISAMGSPNHTHGSHSSPPACRTRHVRCISGSSSSAFQEERPTSAAVTTPLPVCTIGGPSQPQQATSNSFGNPLGHGSRGSWPRRSSHAGSASSGHASRPASASRTRLQRDASGNLQRLHTAQAATF